MLTISSPAFADLRSSLDRAVALSTTAQARPNAKGQNDDNPYFVPAMVLMAGGGLVALYGMTRDTGVACSGTTSATSFSCGVTKSKATIFTGVGLVGVGAFLYYRGKAKQNSSPQIVVGPHGVGVRQSLTW